MGLFSSNKPTPDLPPKDGVTVHPQALELLPDPGDLLLSLYPGGDARDAVAAELARARFPHGGYNLQGVEGWKKSSGPLGLLARITEAAHVAVLVWAADDIRGPAKQVMEWTVRPLNAEQGTPYAASWAQDARIATGAQARQWSHLAHLLDGAYGRAAATITNGSVRGSITEWRR